MKLTKQLNVELFQVLAEYKVKIKNAPFVAVLQAALENDGKLLPHTLKRELLHPMSEAACENILSRLMNMGYFEERYDRFTAFYLTELGMQSAKNKEFFETRKGVLEIAVAEGSEFLPERVVSIKEIVTIKSEDENNFIYLPKSLEDVQNPNMKIPLDNIFILEKIDNKCKCLKSYQSKLSIDISEQDALIGIEKYKRRIEFVNIKSAQLEILTNEYGRNYIRDLNCIKIKFNPNDLSFKRNLNIQKPRLLNTVFNSIKIGNINTQPKTIIDARKWFEALLKRDIESYFLSDEEFNNYTKSISDKFIIEQDKLKGTISREDLINRLDKKKDFYKIAKLETIDYLNY